MALSQRRPGPACEAGADVAGHSTKRHEGDDIDGAETRVDALMAAQVDELDGGGGAGQGGIQHRLIGAGEGDDAAVVVGVGVTVQHLHLRASHGALNLRHHIGATTL